MDNQLPGNIASRDYGTISPSAAALLLLKAHTSIPFTKEAAALLQVQDNLLGEPASLKKDYAFWARVMHFEARYQSVNQLLNELNAQQVLELSSGFSFRGLHLTTQTPVHYIDTDLPGVISVKEKIAAQLAAGTPAGQLEMLPLNALDETQFADVLGRFNQQELVIVNEGLLVYLGIPEKQQLCKLIHAALKQHGGYWITADIYIRNEQVNQRLKIDDQLSVFFEQHNVAENMFASFEDAASFFESNGLVLDKEAEPDYTQLSALPHFLAAASPEQLAALRTIQKPHATWRLRAV